ncbi:MAG: extracellular solute-binding protein [Chloroflexi bacterium]|nr:extracellular solute-binding protein [Chloroflexota bacterium]
MKRRFLAVIIWLTASLTMLACTAPALPAASSPPPGAGVAAPQARSDWDSLVEAARKEGMVMIYHTSIGDARDASAKAFKEKYGITIDYVMGRGPEIVERIARERLAGLYVVDAVVNGATTFYNMVRPQGITVPLEPLFVLPEVTDGSKWRTGKLSFVDKGRTALAFSLTNYIYTTINTDLVKAGELASYEDVLNPKWKGKIVINDPSVSGNGSGWFAFIVVELYKSREKGEDYMRKLARQEPVVIRDQRLQAEWVARGKYPVGIGLEPSQVTKMVESGAPIKPVAMKEGQPMSSGALNLWVYDRIPHPNATKLYVNWVLSPEGSGIMSKYSGYPSARVDVSTEGFDPIFIPGPNDTLPSEEYWQQKDPLMKVAAEIFKDFLQ